MIKKSTRIALLAFITLMALAPLQTAQAQRAGVNQLCTQEEPRVVVRLATAKTKYVKTNNVYDLTSMHNSGIGNVTLGLAGGPMAITTQAKFRMTTLKDRSCVELHKLEVLFWAKPEIHIASNFKKGTCEYKEVLGHEQKHIRTLRKFVREYAPELKKEINKIVDSSRTQYKVKTRDITKAQDRILAQIAMRISSYERKITPILESRQAEIDTPEEYRRVSEQCDNWGRRIGYGR